MRREGEYMRMIICPLGVRASQGQLGRMVWMGPEPSKCFTWCSK
jgi:hypothetical protein